MQAGLTAEEVAARLLNLEQGLTQANAERNELQAQLAARTAQLESAAAQLNQQKDQMNAEINNLRSQVGSNGAPRPQGVVNSAIDTRLLGKPQNFAGAETK